MEKNDAEPKKDGKSYIYIKEERASGRQRAQGTKLREYLYS